MEVKVEKFDNLTAREVYEILALREKVFIVEQDCPYQDCDGKDLEAYQLLCSDKGKVVGTVRILKKGVSYDEASIGRVAVDKEYRGTGLGKIIMQGAIDFMTNVLDEEVIRISAQEYAIGFYEKLGFVTASDVYLEDDIRHVQMICRNS